MDEQMTLLQDWYSLQCDGDWEHCHGIQLSTLDNPGWLLKIDLNETKFQDVQFDKVAIERSEYDWLFCSVTEKRTFEAACGIGNLVEVLQVFNSWSKALSD